MISGKGFQQMFAIGNEHKYYWAVVLEGLRTTDMTGDETGESLLKGQRDQKCSTRIVTSSLNFKANTPYPHLIVETLDASLSFTSC